MTRGTVRRVGSRVMTVLLLAAVAAACQPGGTDSEGDASGGEEETRANWNAFQQEFLNAYYEANPQFAVDAGLHQYDGLFPDWSPAGIRSWIGRLERFRERALAFGDRGLDERQRFARDYLVAVIDNDLFWLRDAGWPWKNPQFYNFSPSVYLTREYAPLPERMKSYTRFASGVPAATQQMLANLRTPLPRTYVDLGQLVFGGLAEFLREDVPQVFAEVDDPALQEAFGTANTAAAEAMRRAADWFEGQREEATSEYAIGPELFRRMLWMTERVDTPLAELRQIAERDLERNLQAMAEACASYAPGATLADCVARMRDDKSEKPPVEAARAQLDRLEQFVRSHGVVSIPSDEKARVDEAPPFNRWNFAYIEIPGPFDQGLPSIYYIAPPDSSWPQAEQRDYLPGEADLLFVSVHEVWPGHFLQFLHAQESPYELGRLFVGYAFAEGWAHYAEEMMWEAGLGEGDPETHIGQIQNALLRNVRFLSALGLHTGDMTVEESESLFRDKAFQDRGNARQQAARGTFDPAYLNYTMGKLMIRKLRHDWTADRGRREAWAEFHDRFLSFGGPPIPLIRRAMLGDQEGDLF